MGTEHNHAKTAFEGITWTVFGCFTGTMPDGSPLDMQSIIDPQAFTFNGKKLEQDAYSLSGFAVRDSMGKRYEELRIEVRKRADKPKLDLVSPQEAAALASHVVALLNDTPAMIRAAEGRASHAEERFAELVKGIEAFYGDAEHVPVGLADLYREPYDY